MSNKTYGEITDKLYFHIHIGDGSVDDKQFTLAVTASIYEPLIICNKKTFHLTWKDIAELAAEKGLFAEDQH